MSDGTATWTNTYSADGLRTKRTNGSTTYSYVYTGSTLLSMTVGNDILYFNYDAAGIPLTVTWNGTTYYYATNLQGDIVAILDSTGAAVVTYTYDAWGNPISTTGTLATTLGTVNPLRYRGYVYDPEIGLYYLQSRYYNPGIGRFINADSFTDTNSGLLGHNMFAYVNNTCVISADSTGCSGELVFIVPVLIKVVEISLVIYAMSEMPSKEEHYSRNKNQEFINDLEAKDIIGSPDWQEQDDSMNIYHRHTMGSQGNDVKFNKKYMSKDKRYEVIINFADPNNPYIVTDKFNMGTYNFGTDPMTHFVKDVFPYWIWGNSEEDSGNEYLWDRIVEAS